MTTPQNTDDHPLYPARPDWLMATDPPPTIEMLDTMATIKREPLLPSAGPLGDGQVDQPDDDRAMPPHKPGPAKFGACSPRLPGQGVTQPLL